MEFAVGALPGAINLPLMNDEERAAVGTTYKQAGRERAIELGHKLVSGEVREARLQKWREFIRCHPEAVLYCFRGGLRSQITQRWLAESGLQRPLIVGGYKKARAFLRDSLEKLSQTSNMVVLSGPTGSAKTHLIQKAQGLYPAIDLEKLARHRGSAFGAYEEGQPSQVDFENALSVEMLRFNRESNHPILVEDESRMIGQRVVPESFFFKMRASKLIYVDEPFEQRVENIYYDYILQTSIGRGSQEKALAQFAKYRGSVQQISRKLGGLRTQEILIDLQEAELRFLVNDKDLEINKAWIGKLLSYYYDPLYKRSWERREPQLLFKGSESATFEYLKTLKSL